MLMKSFWWNLGSWILEIAIWLVGVFWAAQAGAGMGRVALKQLQTVAPGSVHSESARSEVKAERTGVEPQVTQLADPEYPLGGGAARRMSGRSLAVFRTTYGRLPLSFEPNRGQADARVKFLSRSSSHGLFLTSTEAVLQFPIANCGSRFQPCQSANRESEFVHHKPQFADRKQTSQPQSRNLKSEIRDPDWASLRMKLLGANPAAKIIGEQELSGRSHYILGNDPNGWHVNIPNYSRIRYSEVYPGVDLVYYGNQQRMEYDFVIRPGGDPRVITIRFDGTEASFGSLPLSIDKQGDLVLRFGSGEIHQPRAVVYQHINGARRLVAANYVLKGKREVGFELEPYDSSESLVIDPVLTYSATGVGGSAIAVDAGGNAYVIGAASRDFKTTPGAFQTTHAGGKCVNGPNTVPCPDILVAKLNASGTELIYSTFLGGSGSDYGYGIAVDNAGDAYVTGTTTSADFPTTENALQTAHSGGICGNAPATFPCNNAFVTKLNATGTALVYSTYLYGNSGGQGGNGIAVDSSGAAYVTGDADGNGFLTKLNAAGSAAIYSVGGVGGSAVAIDAKSSAYVTGRRGNSSYVTKINADASSTTYDFRLGGTLPSYSAAPEEIEALSSIAVDSAGNAYITGYTAYKDFPTTPGVPFRTAPGAGICGNSLCRDAFITKLNTDGTALVYSTYLGGNSIDYGNSIAVDVAANAYVTGATRSTNFPVTPGASQTTGGGIFVTQLNAAGTAFVYSITLGNGNSNEGGNGIAVDTVGNAYITGSVSSDFSATAGGFQSPSGTNNVFVAKIFDETTLFVPVILSSSGQNGSFFTSEMTLTNRSGKTANLEFLYTAAFGGGSGRATDTLAGLQQRVVPDAITYLRSLGIPIPDSGSRGGTLAVRFSGLNSASEGAVTVRTTSAVARGRAGLAYTGIPAGLTGTAYLCGLRQNNADRSNVAIQNAGNPAEGDITLRLTVFSGDLSNPLSRKLPDEVLSPGGFKQISSILQSNGLFLNNGYVRIERIKGNATYYAYAIINDQASSDGSFVPPVLESSLMGRTGLTLPVIVETSSFNSELVLTNWSATNKTIHLAFVAEGIQAPGSTANFAIPLRAGEQLILPNILQWLRQHSLAGLWLTGQAYVGSMFLTVEKGDVGGLFLGARTSTQGGGGLYGVFYTAVPYGMASTSSTWLYGLQQNSENRTNLGLINTGENNGDPNVFQIELFDGETGEKVNVVEGITLNSRRLIQIGSLLEKYAPGVRQGYAQIRRTEGSNPFIAYAVLNDGGLPGERTGDGAFVPSSP